MSNLLIDKTVDYKYRSKHKKTRVTARGIMVSDDYTKVYINFSVGYNDYTIPGGGVIKNESLEKCLRRELKEELGADEVQVIDYLGSILETGIKNKDNSEQIRENHYFLVNISKFGDTNKDDYEIEKEINGDWFTIEEAINHNTSIVDNSKGIDFDKTVYVLKKIKEYYGSVGVE